MKKIKLLLADDHIVMRMGLATAVGGEPDIQVVAEAGNGFEVLEACAVSLPDVVVLDLRMPKLGGLETIARLRSEFASVRVLVFSNYASGEEVYEAFRAGANGFVVKEMPLESLLEAIRCVYSGGHYSPPELAVRLGHRVVSQLSDRELDVLRLVARGRSNKEIGATLHITEGTVKVHVTSILLKLNAADRTEATVLAMKKGILQLD